MINLTNKENKELIFIAGHKPPLQDGLYTLNLSYNLKYDDVTKTFIKKYKFAVSGERFSLNNNVIHKFFPPANSQGHFNNVLPHVIFNRRTLPWERSPTNSCSASSWLAVLVFESSVAPKPVTGCLSMLYPAPLKDGGGQLSEDIYSYGSPLNSDDAFLEYGEKPDDRCVYIDISKEQFASIAPSLEDLDWNAHARRLTTDGSTTADYSSVVSNRLPIPGAACTAHLVSLEGLGDQLPQDDGTYKTEPNWSTIRLVSLKSWSFAVAPLEASFKHILQGLNGGIDTNGTELEDSQIRLPVCYVPKVVESLKPAPPQVPFDSGYTMLERKDNAGEPPAWYRGPLAPCSVTPSLADNGWSSKLLPSNSSDDLNLKVSPTVVDVSLAAAWQLGRLMALADRKFATDQVLWKRRIRMEFNTQLKQANKPGCGSRVDYAKTMREAISDASQITELLGDSLSIESLPGKLTIPQALVDWMGELALLKGVPVEYLIPDMNMLPSESIKFFYIAPRWLASLLDGAWSLERQPKDRWAFDNVYQPWKQIMDGTLKTSFSQDNCWPKSGFILNSQLIPDYWPGIDFIPATSTSSATNCLREGTLGPSSLIVLFDQEFLSLVIRQPAESIHFGFDMDETGEISKTLRYGNTPNPPSISIPQRNTNVIQLANLAMSIAKSNNKNIDKFTSAEFAHELVELVASAQFQLPKGDK